MKYVKLKSIDPLILAKGPCPLPGVQANITGFDKLAPAELREHGWYPFVAEPDPEFDPRVFTLSRFLALEEGAVRSVPKLTPFPEGEYQERLAQYREQALARLAEYRWEQETGGIEFMHFPVHTDRESQATIALAALQGGTERWKDTKGNWHSLSPEDLKALSEAVMAHKRHCFAREEELALQLREATDYAGIDAVDITGGWG